MLKTNSPFVIAEVAQTHEGSLGLAHAFIDAVAKTGADAIKFQTHIADAESTPEELFRVKFSYEDRSRYEYWKRMEFSFEQWQELKKHAEQKGLVFMSSPFSIEAVDLLESLDISAYKIGSGESQSFSLLKRIAQTKKPVFLSTGVSSLSEIDVSVALLKSLSVPLTLMQCTALYPCPPEKLGLNLIQEFREKYGCRVGLSDHSGTIFPSLAATALGAEALEIHVTLSREMFGPDISSSVTTSELSELVRGVRLIHKMVNNPLKKDTMAEELSSQKKMSGKSAVIRKDLKKGGYLAWADISFKKPAIGFSEKETEELIGRLLARDVSKGSFLRPEHVQG